MHIEYVTPADIAEAAPHAQRPRGVNFADFVGKTNAIYSVHKDSLSAHRAASQRRTRAKKTGFQIAFIAATLHDGRHVVIANPVGLA